MITKSTKKTLLILAGVLVATIIIGNIILRNSDDSKDWFDKNKK